MTLLEIITDAKAITRQNDGIASTAYIAWLNRINRAYCRRSNWPQLRKTSQVLTTVANTAAYDLPTNFNRIMGDFVYWNVTAITGGYNLGTPIPFLNQGSEEDDRKILAYTNLGVGGALSPVAAYRGNKSDGTPQLVLAPFPQLAGTTILYNYYADPTTFTATGDSIPVPTLYDTFVMALAKQICLYLDSAELAAMYNAMERDAFNAAVRTLTFN